ncbi:MAG: glycosyltransferase family 39 protein [Nitrospirae bacterium]|nr:glycosyltransferase family 39 protein [Nitrospirota bacterium]
MVKNRAILSSFTNYTYTRVFGKVFIFILLLILLVTRNTQDVAERMFWLDEVYDFIAINKPFWEIPKFTIKGAFTQPPLFYWIGHFVVRIGTDPLTLRSISLASYVAMIGFVIFALREFQFATRVFLCFVLIMSPFGAYATTEFRPYALAALCILISSVFFYRAIKQPERWLSAILYGLAALAAQYSLTLNSLTFGLQMAFLIMTIVYYGYKEGFRQTLHKYKPLIIVSVPLCIEYAFLLNAIMQTGLKLFPAPQFHLINYIKALLRNIIVLKEDIILIRSWAISFAPAFLLLGCITGMRKYRWITVYLILLFGGQFLYSTFLTYSRIDYPAPQRYFVASYVAFSLLCAIGAEYFFQHLNRRTSVLIVTCLLVTALPGSIIGYAISLKTPGFNPITEAIDGMRCRSRPTVVLTDPGRNAFVAWYAYRNDPLMMIPHQIKNMFPFITVSVSEIYNAASEKHCFILIEGPQGKVDKGAVYKTLSALPGYAHERYSIRPGHVIPDSAWLFTPLELKANMEKQK